MNATNCVKNDFLATHTITATTEGWLGAPARTLGRIFATLCRWQNRSIARARLAEMDDHMMKDIGLDRREIEREAAKPFWRA